MNSTRFLKNFCALGLSVFSAVFALSYAFNADSNNQLDASNEAEVTGTGSAYGSHITTPFSMEARMSMYIDADGYLYGAGENNNTELGNNSTSNVTSWYQLRKNNSDVTSPDGTPKANETGYFSNPRDYSPAGEAAMVIDSDGAVWGSGPNYYGMLGRGDTASKKTFGATNILSGALKIVVGESQSLVLMDDGSVMAAGRENYIGLGTTTTAITTFTETIDRFTVESKRGVVDMAAGQYASYILFGDGDLWVTTTTSTGKETGVGTWDPLASNIKMFDCDGNSSYIYAVTTANVIMYAYYTATTFTQMPTQPTEEVMQIRGAGGEYPSTGEGYYAWGYLTTDGDLYLSSTSYTAGAAYAYSAASLVTNDVSYFDLSGQMNFGNNFGYIDSSTGNLILWGANSMGELSTGNTSAVPYASRKTLNIGLSADDVPDINAGIFNTPPDCTVPLK